MSDVIPSKKYLDMQNRLTEFAGTLPYEQRQILAEAGNLLANAYIEINYAEARIVELIRRAGETTGDAP